MSALRGTVRVGVVITRGAGRLVRAVLALAVLGILLVGVPWALWHFIGWPLPEHVPTRVELQAALLMPMSATQLLDILACLAWPTWLIFAYDVAHCLIEVVRGLRPPETGPVRTLAGFLVTATLLGVLTSRTPTPLVAASTMATPPTPSPVATQTIDATPIRPGDRPQDVRVPTAQQSAADATPQAATVQPPRNGVHDSLWRIATRELGDGRRWPEIFVLNYGKLQPDGGTLVNPNRVFPGEELALPAPTPPAGSDHRPAPPPPLPVGPPASPQAGPPVTPAHPAARRPPIATPIGPALQWGPELFVSLGLAATVSTLLTLARRRYRRHYRPGSARRDDVPLAPVVYQLRHAHLRATAERDEDHTAPANPHEEPTSTDDQAEQPATAPSLGVADGHETALDLATASGLGLTGRGARAAARAVLVTLLTQPGKPSTVDTRPTVLVPATDWPELVGPSEEVRLQRLRVPADLDAALHELEAELLRRTHAYTDTDWPLLVVIARPPQQDTRRLQALLDNGARCGIVGVLLGPWPPGVTAYVRRDGLVAATTRGTGQPLHGAHLFRLPEADTADLLDLLRHTETPPQESDAADARPPSTAVTEPPAPTRPPGDGTPSRSDDVSDSVDVAGSDAALEVTTTAEHDTLDAGGHTAHIEDGAASEHAATATPAAHAGNDAAEHDDHTPKARPLRLTVLGRPRLDFYPTPDGPREITSTIRGRQRELLVFLAVHPDGIDRDTLITTLWSDHPTRRTNALNTALSRLRRTLNHATNGSLTDIVLVRDDRYHLDPTAVTVDFWEFTRALAARRAATTDAARTAANERIAAHCNGPLGDGLDVEWIEPAREATRHDFLDAVAALARAHSAEDPHRVLDLLETARAFDPYNELLYRDIMRLHDRLGQHEAIGHTLGLLATRLAEINDQPSAQTVKLAARLQDRADAHPGNEP